MSMSLHRRDLIKSAFALGFGGVAATAFGSAAVAAPGSSSMAVGSTMAGSESAYSVCSCAVWGAAASASAAAAALAGCSSRPSVPTLSASFAPVG